MRRIVNPEPLMRERLDEELRPLRERLERAAHWRDRISLRRSMRKVKREVRRSLGGYGPLRW
jgi:hypothetical protein